jgi:hypothetical protein
MPEEPTRSQVVALTQMGKDSSERDEESLLVGTRVVADQDLVVVLVMIGIWPGRVVRRRWRRR